MQATEIQKDIYTVSRLNEAVRSLLESQFKLIWVEGEISNFAAPNSGHWYFSLKDGNAQVRCALFRGSQRQLTFIPKDGQHVLISARVSIYANRGEYQLIAEWMEERGEGKLRRAYELLKKKLEMAGLFQAAHKQVLPAFPKTIGVITSSTGAAIRDILIVLKRRCPHVGIIIYPTLVQGQAAATNIVEALQAANRRNECDVLIIARGGGSLEDLWPFNEEMVAHAIHASKLPIISGVGHEVDFTIADYVADQRAPTPSAAAEMATCDRVELISLLLRHHAELARQIQRKLAARKQTLGWTEKHLSQQHPKRRLLEQCQRLDFAELTLLQLQTKLINQLQHKVKAGEISLHRLLPTHLIKSKQMQVHAHAERLNALMNKKLNQHNVVLANLATKLDALSPLSTLQRGYAIASKENNHVIRSTTEVNVGENIYVRLTQGTLQCRVNQKI